MDPTTIDPRIQPLRDQVALLISRNLELQRRIQDLEREKQELAVEALATTLARAVDSAQAAMDSENPAAVRYIIGQLQATLRGVVAVSGDSIVLRLPRPEESILSGQLGTLQISIAGVPAAQSTAAAPTLKTALENAQATFGASNPELGATLAQDLLTQTTHLLAMQDQSDQPEFLRGAQSLGDKSAKFADAVASSVPAVGLAAYRTATARFQDLVARLAQAGHLGSADLPAFVAALQDLTAAFQSMLP